VWIGGMMTRPGAGADSLLPFYVVTGGLALLVIIRHRGNLARTFQGREPKIGKRGG